MDANNWVTFVLADAIAGKRVGLKQSDPNDVSMTGLLGQRHTKTENGVTTDLFDIEIDIYKMTVDTNGIVQSCKPTYSGVTIGTTALKMVDVTLAQTHGSDQTMTRSPESGYTSAVSLSTMEPRDNFALTVLGILLRNVKDPTKVDDANKLFYCDAAYAWANVMMISASNSRNGTAVSPGPGTVDIHANDLQSNSEKLLYNLVEKIGEIKTQLGTNKTQLTTDIGTIHTDLGALTSQIAEDNEDIIHDLDSIAIAMAIEDIENPIVINVTVQQKKFIRLEVQDYMVYSDLSVYMEMNVLEGATAKTRQVSFILKRGSVVVVEPLDSLVDEITSITQMELRGKAVNDPNDYHLTQPTPNP